MSILRTIARPLLAAPFALTGIDALLHPHNHRERARVAEPLVEKCGLTLDDSTVDTATRALGATFVLASAGLSFGVFPRASAGLLACVQLPVTLANYPVWKRERRLSSDLSGLATSAALVGGALIASFDRQGKPSLVWRVKDRRARASHEG